MKIIRRSLLLVALVGALHACGGGAGGPSDPSPGGGGQPATPPVTGSGVWTVRLSWQDSGEPRLAGYRVYHGLTSAASDERFEAGLSTSFDYSTSTNGPHYFALAAIDLSGVESPRTASIMIDLK
jgi:hypothetical protein